MEQLQVMVAVSEPSRLGLAQTAIVTLAGSVRLAREDPAATAVVAGTCRSGWEELAPKVTAGGVAQPEVVAGRGVSGDQRRLRGGEVAARRDRSGEETGDSAW